MSYHNQFSYKTIPYPHISRPDATVATSGCGVCCMSMVVEGIMGEAWPPKQSAAYSISVGARASTGTDMALLGHKTSDKFGIGHKTSSNVNTLIEALQNGAWAIANVGGDRAGYKGLFSDGGHYIVVSGIKDGKFIVWDPGYYAGKFNKAGRTGKVTVRGNDIYVLPEYLDKDCSNRSPRYYIFEEEPMTQAQFNEMINVYLESRDKLPVSGFAKENVDKAKAEGISDGTSPHSFATREEVITMIIRAQK